MKVITNDPNLPLAVTLEGKDHDALIKEAKDAQKRAQTTVIDASDRTSQFGDFAPGMKGPTKHVFSSVESKAISKAQTSEERRPFYG